MSSTVNDPGSLAERVEILEQQNRWMRRCLVCTVVAAGSLFLVAANNAAFLQKAEKTIEAEQIIIRDQTGKKRIFLGIDDKAAVVYLMDGSEKRAVAAVAHQTDQAGIQIDQGGKVRMMFGTGTGKFAGLAIHANPGKPKEGQIALFYANDGKAGLFFNDQNNQTRARMILDTDGKAGLSLEDKQGNSFFSQVQP